MTEFQYLEVLSGHFSKSCKSVRGYGGTPLLFAIDILFKRSWDKCYLKYIRKKLASFAHVRPFLFVDRTSGSYIINRNCPGWFRTSTRRHLSIDLCSPQLGIICLGAKNNNSGMLFLCRTVCFHMIVHSSLFYAAFWWTMC